MHPMLELLKQIEVLRAALLEDYEEDELHQLRVRVRRLRGQLRFEGSPEALGLRWAWGSLISHTNGMRDWDTLAARVNALPENELPVGLANPLTDTRQRIWKKTRRSLESRDWENSVRRTRAFLQHRAAVEHEATDTEARIEEAGARLRRAWTRAQKHDNSKAWHKLRIAVKDLRYSLDMLGEDSTDQRIDICKELQTQLGTWHDSIVHRRLLEEIGEQLGENETVARQGVKRLRKLLKREGKQCLQWASDILTNQGSRLMQ